jgi:RNA recognition motif-containing protein
LKNSLRTLFQQFGEVLDVVAHPNIRMRGQAFVAFPDEECAEKAIKDLQHFSLYNKPMVLQFARNKSDVHAKKDGDYDAHYKQRMHRKG